MTQPKILLLPAAALALTLAAAASPTMAQAPAPAASAANALEGRVVRGRGGVVLGHVERVVLHRDGTPAQVLVRPLNGRAAGPRSLAYSAVRIDGDGLSIPLTAAEFNAMPAVDVTRE